MSDRYSYGYTDPRAVYGTVDGAGEAPRPRGNHDYLILIAMVAMTALALLPGPVPTPRRPAPEPIHQDGSGQRTLSAVPPCDGHTTPCWTLDLSGRPMVHAHGNGDVIACGYYAIPCQPLPVPVGSGGGTAFTSAIAVTDTFQTVFSEQARRTGCLITNLGDHNELIALSAAPSKVVSFILAPGNSFACMPMIPTERVYIAGQAGDRFYAEESVAPSITTSTAWVTTARGVPTCGSTCNCTITSTTATIATTTCATSTITWSVP